jgi:hypothetical protein
MGPFVIYKSTYVGSTVEVFAQSGEDIAKQPTEII